MAESRIGSRQVYPRRQVLTLLAILLLGNVEASLVSWLLVNCSCGFGHAVPWIFLIVPVAVAITSIRGRYYAEPGSPRSV